MATVAVTGAGGFLGSHIALALRAAGHGVVGVVRSPSRAEWLEAEGVALRTGDLGDADSLSNGFKGSDCVVANAALGSPGADGSRREDSPEAFSRLAAANATGLLNTLVAASRAGVARVILISSAGVYRTRLWPPMDESTPLRPYPAALSRLTGATADLPEPSALAREAASVRCRDLTDFTTDWRYAMTKAAGEHLAWQLAARLGLALTSLRPGPVYGGRDPRATRRLAASLGAPLRVVPTVRVPWIHAGDVAGAVVAALDSRAAVGQAYNLAGPPTSQLVLMRALRAALEAHVGRGLARLVPVPVPLGLAFDTRAAARDLGLRPCPLEVGVAEAVANLDPSVLEALAGGPREREGDRP